MTSQKDENRFFSVNHHTVNLIASYAFKKGKIYSPQRIKSICELYAVLKNIWERGKTPFDLSGKTGKWKKVTQSWLAEKSTCSIKTIERRIKDLQDIGLIKYVRHGYISHKYIQLIPLSKLDKDDLSDKVLSESYQPNCSSPKRRIVFNAEDKLSEPNIRKEVKGKKEVFIDKKYKLLEELNSQKDLINIFWNKKSGKKNLKFWYWQINEFLLLKTKYGEKILESQLNNAISKGWNSISLLNYEKFNDTDNQTKNLTEITEGRISNMEIHINNFGIKSPYYEDKNEVLKNAYRKLLFDKHR